MCLMIGTDLVGQRTNCLCIVCFYDVLWNSCSDCAMIQPVSVFSCRLLTFVFFSCLDFARSTFAWRISFNGLQKCTFVFFFVLCTCNSTLSDHTNPRTVSIVYIFSFFCSTGNKSSCLNISSLARDLSVIFCKLLLGYENILVQSSETWSSATLTKAPIIYWSRLMPP